MRLLAKTGALIFIIVFIFSARSQSAGAADLFQEAETSYQFTFGKQIIFRLTLPPGEEIQNIQVFFRVKGSNTSSGSAIIQGPTAVYTQSMISTPLPPFREIEYWFGFNTSDGKSHVTATASFFYEDNRFEWQTLDDTPFKVHWYKGDLQFGQMVLDAAQTGLRKAGTLMNFTASQNVNIYVYASGADLQSSLQLAAVNLIAGHADPSLGVMVVSLPEGPAQRMEAGRQVPHELMHILLYQKFGPQYTRIPTWLNEGMASSNEELPNPDYFIVLQDAARKSSLIPFSNLCNGFPLDAASFYQSYAQSASFVEYLYKNYGSSKLESLLELYSDGVTCVKGTQDILGHDLNSLDKQWQAEMLGVTPGNPVSALVPVSPWMMLLVLMLNAPLFLLAWQFYRYYSKK